MPDRTPERMLEDVPERIPEDVPHTMPKRVPEDMQMECKKGQVECLNTVHVKSFVSWNARTIARQNVLRLPQETAK